MSRKLPKSALRTALEDVQSWRSLEETTANERLQVLKGRDKELQEQLFQPGLLLRRGPMLIS